MWWLIPGTMFRVTTNAKHWQPIQDDVNLAKYACVLHALAKAVLLSLQNHESGYKFPVNDITVATGNNLLAALDNSAAKESGIAALHSFVYPFLAAREIEGQYNKWEEVMECFLAIYFLQADGNFKDAKDVTQPLAILKYLCRGSTLFESFQVAKKFNVDPHKSAANVLVLPALSLTAHFTELLKKSACRTSAQVSCAPSTMLWSISASPHHCRILQSGRRHPPSLMMVGS
jgi:hypothetical protein